MDNKLNELLDKAENNTLTEEDRLVLLHEFGITDYHLRNL